MKNRIHILLGLVAVVALAAGCSTTKRLGEGQTLYTGVKKIEIKSVATGEKDHGSADAAKAAGSGGAVKVPGSVAAAVTAPLAVSPNNPLISPWVRTPLPIGLWAYNSLYTEKKRGLRALLYRTFAKQPIVIERDVQPLARTSMVRDILDNHGYFGSRATFELYPRGEKAKTARIGYKIDVAPPWFFETVRFPIVRDSLSRVIATITATSNIKPGLQYNIDTLAREQVRITNALRAKGYYWFRPEYLEYKADTTRVRHGIDLHMDIARTAPPAALVPYRVGDVSLRIFSADGRGRGDSVEIDGKKVWFQRSLKLRHSVIRRAMTLQKGQVAGLGDINRMLDNLTRIGVFRYVNPEITPLEALQRGDSLDVTVSAAMNTPMEMIGEADLAYKSSSFLGPAVSLSFGHGNIFKGGEILSLNLVGSYEWQTGNTSQGANSTTVNSYEIGVNASLVFPRMLVPDFMGRELPYGGKTSYTLGVNLLNRPKFFRMITFGWTNTYDFRTSSTVYHSFTPFKMAYNKLLNTTEQFDDMLAENERVARSFDDQFVPSASYTYSYDKLFGRLRRDRIVVQATLMSAGNLWAAVYGLLGQGGGAGSKRLFGDPFSQFFKETAEVRIYKQLGRAGVFAFRAMAGAGHAYGNSSVLPYTEQFYSGGANSIRAFTVRSLGPGTYRATSNKYGYFDQTGDLKLEINAEYRFRISGGLHGAVFFDAGNVWLLKDDPSRPGGKIGGTRFFNSVATGTGAGVRYDMSFLVIRFDLGVGIHLPYETSRTGYYNIPRFKDGLGYQLAIGYPF